MKTKHVYKNDCYLQIKIFMSDLDKISRFTIEDMVDLVKIDIENIRQKNDNTSQGNVSFLTIVMFTVFSFSLTR